MTGNGQNEQTVDLVSTRRRNTDKEARIKQAFATLLLDEGFDKVTVSKITTAAGVNRGTFYLHYTDKYDLLRAVEDDMRRQVIGAIDNWRDNTATNLIESINKQAILAALVRIRHNLALIQALVASEGSNSTECFKDTIKEVLYRGADRQRANRMTSSGVPEKYIDEMLLSAVVSIIIMWIRDDCRESPELMANVIEQLKTTAPADLL